MTMYLYSRALTKCSHCNTCHQTIDEIKFCNDLIDTKTGKKEIMKPFKPGVKVRCVTRPHITGTVKWVKLEPNGVYVNRQNSRGKWNLVEKIPKGGYTIAIKWDPIPQIGYYPEFPPHGLQNPKTIELVPQENVNQQQTTTKEVATVKQCNHKESGWEIISPEEQVKQNINADAYCDICDQMLIKVKHERKEAMSNQPTTTNREVKPMSKCKHQIWDWKLIPGQVNTDYKAVYCELCGEQLAQLAPKENPMTVKQINFIRSLFKEVGELMTIDEQESLIAKMNAHKNGTHVLTTKWASAAIDKLKAYKPKPVKPVQVKDEHEPFGKVQCPVCDAQYHPEEMGGSGTKVFVNGCVACLSDQALKYLFA